MRKFAPKTFVDVPSIAYIRAVQALRTLGENEGVEMVTRAFAEAAAPLRREQFQKIYNVKRSNGRDWVGRLLGVSYYRWNDSDYERPEFPSADHESVWVRDGKPVVYVSEPYEIHMDELREMVRFCDEYGLDATITGWRSMWFPGATVAVVVRKREAEPCHCPNCHLLRFRARHQET